MPDKDGNQMIRPQHVRQLASELELISHGSCAAWNPAGGSSVPDSREPTGEAHPPHLQFILDWERKGETAVRHWTEVLNKWRGHGVVRAEGKTEDEIIIEDGEGHSPRDVAQRFRCTPTRVRRLRVADGRDGETGVRLRELKATISELREQRLSYREVAERLGRSKSQIERVDKAA